MSVWGCVCACVCVGKNVWARNVSTSPTLGRPLISDVWIGSQYNHMIPSHLSRSSRRKMSDRHSAGRYLSKSPGR